MKNQRNQRATSSFINISRFKKSNDLKSLLLSALPIALGSLFAITASQSLFAHENEAEQGGVEHAKEDYYWAEQAKNYPAFVPKTFSRTAQRSAVIDGAWGSVIQWPHIPVTAANLPDGRILTYASNKRTRFPAGTEFTYAATWNPTNNNIVERNHTSHDMFCGHLSTLEDGRIFVNGGTNHVKTTSIFDYRTNSWQKIDQMNRGRWYPTTVALPTGSVLTAIGSSGGEYPELWTEGQGWKTLTGASLQTPILSYTQFFERNWWPLLHVDPRGKVFHSGPTPKMHSINTEGLGSVTKVGPENHDWYPKHGTTVMFDEGKLLVAGGAISGSNSRSTNKAMIIDISGEEPQVTQIAPMTYARKFQNGVMLPTGEVLVVGGNTSGIKFNDSGTILPTEIWNPETRTWRTIDSISVPRNYHSIALLLTDGRVLSAGGGLCGCAADHQDGQVLTPPYLYNTDGSLATRPVISNAPDVIKNGQLFNLQSDTDITKFSLIKMSATTHAVNTDLRYLKLPFTHDNNGNYQLSAHNNINVMTPGFWMLFAVNSKGVPSIAKIIQVSTDGLPRITQPLNQISTVGENVSLAIIANDPQGETLQYTATGLPQGLSINQNTGVITGRLNTAGLYSPVITVSDAESSVVAQFNWVVYAVGTTPGVSYEYFEGNWAKLPDFNTLTPVTTGTFSNFNISPRAQNDNFAFRLSARIKITQAGNYTFYTRSDDGSRLWINGNLVVDNDGLHASQERSGTINLSTGSHLIVVGFFERDGAEGLSVQYSSSSISKRQIPASLLVQNPQQNNAPVVNNPGNQTSSLNASVNLNIIATDANGDTLSYTATGLPNGLNINSSTGRISGTSSTAGSFAITITVSDGQGESASVSFNWQIVAPISITPIQSSPKQLATSVNYNAIVSGGSSLRYRWNFGDNTATTPYSGSSSISHTFSNAGTYVVTLFVQNGSDTPLEHQFVQAIYAPTTASQASHSSSIVYEVVNNNNNRVWNVNPDNNTVSAFDTIMHAKFAEISVGKAPHALALAPNGRLWVTNKDSATISIINTSTQKVVQTINFQAGSQPFGLAFSPTGSHAYVTLEGSGKLIRLDPVSGAVLSTLDLGERPRHVSVDASGDKIFVSRFVTPPIPDEDTANPKTTVSGQHFGGEVLLINSNNFTLLKTIILRHSERQDAEHSARGIPNYLGPVVISPDGTSAWVSSKQDNIKRGVLRDGNQLTHDSAVRSISSKINLNSELEDPIARVDHDNGGIASTALFSKHGNYLFVALEGSREIAVVDGYSNEEFYRFDVGRAPQGLALSPDGLTLYTHNFMDRSISVHDVSPIINARDTRTALVSVYNTVSNERLALNVFNGKQLFYDARDQRLASEQYTSCASCHNDGDSDGRVWDMTGFGEGLRNTIGLIGHGGVSQGPLHWTANFDEVQDFEGQIRTLSGGTGLMADSDFHSGTRSQPLGDSKVGLSGDLDDLAAYVQSLNTVPVSPFKNQDGSLTSSALQGQQLFADKGCNSCHSGQHFTDSAPNNLHDVGTLRSSSGQRLNAQLDGLDTPTLRGLWLTAPYLHNGSAATIENAIAAHVNNNINASLTSSERTHLANFLSQLDRTINVSSSTSNEVPVGRITINGLDSDWNGLSAFSNDPDDISGTNNPINWQNVSFAHDTETLYLLYTNYGNIDPQTTTGSYLSWGRQAFIDTDKNSSTGYQVGSIGADYVLEGNQMLRYIGTGSSWDWSNVGEGVSRYNANIAEISISRSLLGNPESVYVVFMGDNGAYNGNTTDLYPDSLNSSQGNQQFFEYEFAADTTPPLGIPVALGQSISVLQNTSEAITLHGTDLENDPLTFFIFSQPTHGTLTGTGRNISYTPDAGYTGSDSFSFIVNDGSQNSDPATVSITVRPEQIGPISNPVNNIDIDGNTSDWIGVTRFADDPNDVSGSDNTIDWQNAAIAHNNDKLFILYKNRRQIESGSGFFIPWGWQTFIDTDNNASSGYQVGAIGADYILEGGQLLQYSGTGPDWNWTITSAAQVLYNNDTVELSFDRSAIGNPTLIRVVFAGDNQAYEGTALDYYPDNAEGFGTGEQYFEYSLAQSLQAVNRPLARSQSHQVQVNNSLSLNLNLENTDENDLRYIIISAPLHGELSGTGANRIYTPTNDYQGSDQIRYVIQNGTYQSSVTTIQFKVGEESESSSGGGSLPVSILLPLLMLLGRRYSLRVM